jgi:ribosomal protein S18 acetylase RimI-like enzyme
MIVEAREAELDDADDLVRMAEVMFAGMGIVPPDGWRAAAGDEIRRRLGHDTVGFVVEDDTGTVISSGIGVLTTRMPSVRNLSTRVGYVQWVATDPEHRHRGCARAVMTALVAWFRAQGAAGVELYATNDGEPLYRSLGFGVGQSPGLRLELG